MPSAVRLQRANHHQQKHTPQIVHAVTGVVRSPLMTTLMQVASRLLLTWGIANIAPIAQNHYFLASMVRLAPTRHLSAFALSLLYPHISPSLALLLGRRLGHH
jgi:very-long-chain (3R)-3-hydroxyacyl-CoA dehydratase